MTQEEYYKRSAEHYEKYPQSGVGMADVRTMTTIPGQTKDDVIRGMRVSSMELVKKATEYYRQQKYPQALECAEKGVALAEQVFPKEIKGGKHPMLVGPYITLGDIYVALRRYDEAAKTYQRAISILEISRTSGVKEALDGLYQKMAEVNRKMGNMENAAKYERMKNK